MSPELWAAEQHCVAHTSERSKRQIISSCSSTYSTTHGSVRSVSREGAVCRSGNVALQTAYSCVSLPKVSLWLQVSEVSGPGHFKATSNDRVNLMYKEGCEFARRLDKCARQIKAVESATSGHSWRNGNIHRFRWR